VEGKIKKTKEVYTILLESQLKEKPILWPYLILNGKNVYRRTECIL
jgi:hypothetical protein